MLGAVVLLGACDGPQSALQPNGPRAEIIARMWWVFLAISTIVCLAVVVLLAYALLRRREFRGSRPPLRLTPKSEQEKAARLRGEEELTESDDDPLDVWMETEESDRRSIRWIVAGGAVVPLVILTGTLVFALGAMGLLHAPGERAELTVEVIGWQWWWEVHYFDPGGGQLFETANEIHIPVGKRVRVRLKSADVIHSFWVPQLSGKLDMIPGRTTQFWIQADRAGVYRGQCAEYCEEQHAHMSFLVIAEPEEEFRAWALHQARDEVELADPLAAAGREVFLRTACRACHAVRGTPAVGNIGPDLTHVASRRTLAAVTIPNTRGHLGGWIANPHKVKPGVHMPAVPMDSEAFLALLHYMESLR